MKKRPAEKCAEGITRAQVRSLCERLTENKRVRRTLPLAGRVHIDRQLPFLCVYRRPTDRDDAGTERLVTSEASYLIVSADPGLRKGVRDLVEGIARAMVEQFGAFLIVEYWADEGTGKKNRQGPQPAEQKPRLRLLAPAGNDLAGLIESFEKAAASIKIAKRAPEVEVRETARRSPDHAPPIVPAAAAREWGCHLLGLRVRPIYRNPVTGEVYPLLLREYRRGLSRSLRRMFFEFTRTHTTHRPGHFHVLGRRAVVKAVWDVDRHLADVSDSFDFLLQVTPVNAQRAWQQFQRDDYNRQPVFRYRPLPVDPVLLKRRLYATPVERVEDPTLLQLFRQKQDELDRKISMLLDINTHRFVHGSIQTFGGVDEASLRLAEQLLERMPPRTRDDSKRGYLDTATVKRLARSEITYYRRQWSKFKAEIRVRDDIASGMMVSRGSLLISRDARIPAARADALLQHEIGTHLVTYYNGRAQPFRQLYSGLAEYESLQEGLAVLAEYLAGGLSRPRLRLLAARVVAVRRLLEGASFLETYRELDRAHDFERRAAFNVTMRVYRGGGLTKDAIYLRGLSQLLDYLGKGGQIDPLLVGKIAAEHVPLVRELQWRKVLIDPPLRPRYLDEPRNAKRLARARSGLSVLQLIDETKR